MNKFYIKLILVLKSIAKTRFLLLLLYVTVMLHTFAQGNPSTPFLFSQDLSSPFVTSFAEDKDGFMWIGTNHGLNRFNGTFYDIHYTYSNDYGLNNDNITCLMEDKAGDLWLLTESGLSVRRNSLFYHYSQSGFSPIWQLVDIDNNYLLIADNKGVSKIQKSDLSLAYHYKSLKVGVPKPIGAADNGCVFMTREDKSSDQIVILDEQLREIGSLNFDEPSVVSKILPDRDGSNWIVTSTSLYHLTSNNLPDPREERNNQVALGIGPSFLDFGNGNNVTNVCEYDKDFLLLCIQNVGLVLVDKKTGRMNPIHNSEKLPEPKTICFVDSHRNIWISDGKTEYRILSPDMEYQHIAFTGIKENNFKRLCFDADDRLWARSSNDIVCYEPQTHKYSVFSEPDTFYGDLFIDSQNRLWTIEKYTQIKCYEILPDPANNVGVKLKLLKQYNLPESLFSISEDKDHKIWFTLAENFAVIDANGNLSYEEGPFKVNFTSLQSNKKSSRSFLYTVENSIYELSEDNRFQKIGAQVPGIRIAYSDSRKNLWIGSSNKGLVCYNEQTYETEFLQDKMEIGAYDVKAIEEDSWGNIWFSTSTMVFRYNPHDGNIITIHDNYLNHGVVYNLYTSAADSHGRLYFGGTNGITVVDPVGLKYQKKEIPIKIEDIVINGDRLYEYDGKPFTLSHSDNMIVFWFSGLEFFLGKQLSYEYRLDCYDKNWSPVGHQTRISYSGLPAGKYNLKIRVKTLYGTGNVNEVSVPFDIKPAPWLTIWAKLAYIIIIILIVFAGLRHLIRWRVREERYALLQQREAVNRGYLRFVTNISHEFRTPLSMMYAPLIEFMSGKTFFGKDKELLEMVKRNSERLRTLTEQVLSAGRGNNKENKLQVLSQDIVSFVKMNFGNFQYLAEEKSITMHLNAPDSLICAFDNDKVERIISNLLSNSIKYTPENGEVWLDVAQNDGYVVVKVSDNGLGVPENKRKDLFKRLERLEMESRNPNISGTGIGLYYSRYLADMHKAKLEYEPNKPQGSCFSLSLPADISAYDKSEIKEDELVPVLPISESAEAEEVNYAGSLFIVEDNPDVRQFLQMSFGTKYKLFISSNGAEALDNLTNCIPDLIISDVRMPIMGGHELCSKLKQSQEYGHIPIILLSAVEDKDQAVEMMKVGADAYVQKPFDPRQLAAMVDNMIENRHRVQRAISSLTSTTLAKDKNEQVLTDKNSSLSEAERNFLETFYMEIDKHLADEDFGVEEMGKALGIGEAKLYAKVKTLTGQTPKAFLVTYRMNKAMELLKSGKYNVSEVGYMVGATSLAVFSRSFKHQFGISPSAVEHK